MADEPRAMTQEEIDALFASLSGSLPAVPAATTGRARRPPTASIGSPANSANLPQPKDQKQKTQKPALPTHGLTAATARVSQPQSSQEDSAADDIDALLTEMGAGASPVAPARPAADPASLDNDDASEATLTNDLGDELDDLTSRPSATKTPVGQDDIDALLAELGGGVAPVSESIRSETATNEKNNIRTNLSAEELDSLVAKHSDSRDDSEALIDQDDIDALVKQMGAATGAPDQRQITAIMSRRGSDIEALLDQAANDLHAADAVSDLAAFDYGPNRSQASGQMVPLGAMAPEELRGTRFLLATAVFLLAMCVITMVFVVTSINQLSSTLQENRDTTEKPGDNYADALRTGLALLADGEIGHGRQFLKNTRQKHPNRDAEVTLILARNYFDHQEYDHAAKEFSIIGDRSGGGLLDDPQIYLEWARSYVALDQPADARRILGLLLANEHRFLGIIGNRDELSADQRQQRELTIRQAYLLLGSIDLEQLALTNQRGGTP